jgi:erythromycin esterase
VGLGEETHGTHEFIQGKARLAEYLIAHLGFTTFVMENNWGASRLIDAYINGGPGDSDSVMRAGLFASWWTQEYRALLEWMRAYNADPAHASKIHFLGMDIQGVSQSDFDAVEQYVHQVAPERVAEVQSLYAPIIASSLPSPYPGYVTLDAATKQQFQDQAQQVYDLLQAHQQAYSQLSSPQRFAFALQNARILVQFTTYLNYSSQDEQLAHFWERDTFMAENVSWMYDHAAGSAPKLMVWAHDAHIASDTTYPASDGRNMGGELRARFQERYLALGTTLTQGTFRTYQYPSSSVEQVPAPDATTYNATLGQVGLPFYLLDLRHLPPGPVATWASSHTLLNYGLGGEDLRTTGPLSQWFDVLLHVQKTTPSIPI